MKKYVALFLTLLLVAALCVPTFAAEDKGEKEYTVYTCLGDSVAAGTSQPKDGVEDHLFDYSGDDFATYISDFWSVNSTIIYRGYTPEVVPTAYHSLVANALGAKVNQCARAGIRAVEVRYMLTGEYAEPDTTYSWGNAFLDHDGNGFDISDLDYINDLYQFADKIAEADIITIGLGANDVITPTLGVLTDLLGSSDTDAEMNAIIRELQNAGTAGAVYAKLVSLSQTAGKYATLIENMIDTFNDSLARFKENYPVIIDKIYELNPDVTILCVSTINTFNNTKLTTESKLTLSLIAAPFVNKLNSYMRSLSRVYGSSFIFVDITGAQLYDAVISEPYYSEYLTAKVHPTIAGHQYIAEKILSCIPGYSAETTETTETTHYAALGTAACAAILAAHLLHMVAKK